MFHHFGTKCSKFRLNSYLGINEHVLFSIASKSVIEHNCIAKVFINMCRSNWENCFRSGICVKLLTIVPIFDRVLFTSVYDAEYLGECLNRRSHWANEINKCPIKMWWHNNKTFCAHIFQLFAFQSEDAMKCSTVSSNVPLR